MIAEQQVPYRNQIPTERASYVSPTVVFNDKLYLISGKVFGDSPLSQSVFRMAKKREDFESVLVAYGLIGPELEVAIRNKWISTNFFIKNIDCVEKIFDIWDEEYEKEFQRQGIYTDRDIEEIVRTRLADKCIRKLRENYFSTYNNSRQIL